MAVKVLTQNALITTTVLPHLQRARITVSGARAPDTVILGAVIVFAMSLGTNFYQNSLTFGLEFLRKSLIEIPDRYLGALLRE